MVVILILIINNDSRFTIDQANLRTRGLHDLRATYTHKHTHARAQVIMYILKRVAVLTLFCFAAALRASARGMRGPSSCYLFPVVLEVAEEQVPSVERA